MRSDVMPPLSPSKPQWTWESEATGRSCVPYIWPVNRYGVGTPTKYRPERCGAHVSHTQKDFVDPMSDYELILCKIV